MQLPEGFTQAISKHAGLCIKAEAEHYHRLLSEENTFTRGTHSTGNWYSKRHLGIYMHVGLAAYNVRYLHVEYEWKLLI